MSRWKIATILSVAIALFALCAAPALAETTITVPTFATIPGSGGNPSPIIQNVWVFDNLLWSNGAVMTGSPATGGGTGAVSGGGIGGGGTIDLYGVVNPNGNNLDTMQIRGWIKLADGSDMLRETDASATLDINHARAMGYITDAQQTELLLKVTNSHEWGIYHVTRSLPYCDPAGSYDGTVKAVAGSAFDEHSTPFTYLDVVAMDVDYHGGIQFGPVMPGATKVVSGDFDFGGSMPTAQNLGNVPLALGFMYSPMTRTGGTPADVINNFDLQFQASTWTDLQKEIFDPIAANTLVNLAKPLPLCNRAKMNFSLHAPNNIQPADYTGTFKIMFSKAL